MKNFRQMNRPLVGAILFLMAALLFGCYQVPPPPVYQPPTTPAPATTVTATPEAAAAVSPQVAALPDSLDPADRRRCETTSASGRRNQRLLLQDTPVRLDDQLILSGPAAGIAKVLAVLDLGEALTRHLGSLQQPLDGDGRLVALYQLSPDAPLVEQIACQINSLGGDTVQADPNYVVSIAQWLPPSGAWGETGAWAQGLGAAEVDFAKQWALGTDGIDLNDGSGMRRPALADFQGQGITIAIFDTSPFPEPLGVANRQTYPAVNLTVIHPQGVEPASIGASAAMTRSLVASHGLYLYGLAHAVAPASQVQLVRALGPDGQGDLYSLIKALYQYGQERGDSLADTVINLSLGIHYPQDANNPDRFGLPAHISSLNHLLAQMREAGAVIVAAAGNDSMRKAIPSPAEVPARYDFVIGVAASARARADASSALSCFSNAGDVAAPGGDGRGAGCALPQCDAQNEDACLVGPVYGDPFYVYWTGTSFAAPLTSGLAALLLEQDLTAPEVQTALVNCAQETNSVIDIAYTMQNYERCLASE